MDELDLHMPMKVLSRKYIQARRILGKLDEVENLNVYSMMKYEDFSYDEAINFVGGNLPGLADLCLSFLIKQGLLPTHSVLDAGCGCLRCSIPLIQYLNKDKYFGIDGNMELIKAGEKSMSKSLIEEKNPRLLSTWDWDFGLFNQDHFDVIFSQGVICHTPEVELRAFMQAVRKHLNWRSFVSFIEGERTNKNPYYWSADDIRTFAMDSSLEVESIVDWEHPRHLKMCIIKCAEKDVHEKSEEERRKSSDTTSSAAAAE